MSERIIYQYGKFDFFKRLIFTLKVNVRLKDCNNIETYLLSNNYLKTLDNKLNLIISDEFSNKIGNSYFLYKGYTPDGSLTYLEKYTIIEGKIEKHIDVLNLDIIVIDIYEKNVCLHSYSKDDHYITGYLIKEETNSRKNKTLIFSNQRIKLNIKNIYKFDVFHDVDDFINKFYV